MIGMGYELKLLLQLIYEWADTEKAKKMFRNRLAWLYAMRGQTGAMLEPKARAVRIIEGDLEGMLAHWIQRLTTAPIGGSVACSRTKNGGDKDSRRWSI